MNPASWWQQAALVAVGGALGSVGRFAVVSGLARIPAVHGLPWGTFAVNLIGSFLAGITFVFLQSRGINEPWWRALVMIGAIGGFTTWSSLVVEVYVLSRNANPAWAGGYVLASLVCSVILLLAGMVLGQGLFRG
ncbi:MAG: CrcB family protein [Lysobacteraceae bacterium]